MGVALRLLGFLVACWLALVGVAWVFQRRLVYFPFDSKVPPAATVIPGSEEITIRTEDGLDLGGWFVPSGGGKRPVVLVFNGNAGDRSHRAPLARALVRAGFSVLLFDYRGYGGNPGSPSERGLFADARAARAFLDARDDVDGRRIVYFGESLGCAPAVALALEHPPRALVLRSPFTSLADVGRWHYPFLPVRLLLTDSFPSLGRIPRVRSPVLVVAGENDRIVPPSHSRRVFEAAAGPKRYVSIPGADHNDEELLAGERLMQELLRFLNEAAGSPVSTAWGPGTPGD